MESTQTALTIGVVILALDRIFSMFVNMKNAISGNGNADGAMRQLLDKLDRLTDRIGDLISLLQSTK